MSTERQKEHVETVEEMLCELREIGADDTVSQLMEVYESIERSYRAAAMAGEASSQVAYSTNY
jgi:hypothetical protein